MNNSSWNNQVNLQVTKISINTVVFEVNTASKLGSLLKDLHYKFNLLTELIKHNEVGIRDTSEVMALLRTIEDEIAGIVRDVDKANLFIKLFESTFGFIQLYQNIENERVKNSAIDDLSALVRMIYEINFSSYLDNTFWFNLKLHQWLKKENKLMPEVGAIVGFSGLSHNNNRENQHFTCEELDEFFEQNRWKIIEFLPQITINSPIHTGTYYFINDPLSNPSMKKLFEMYNQIKGLNLIDIQKD